LQLETIEQNNRILNKLGSLDGKMDSVSSRVDSVGFGVQRVEEKVQDIIQLPRSPERISVPTEPRSWRREIIIVMGEAESARPT
jgi:hypothetical protein